MKQFIKLIYRKISCCRLNPFWYRQAVGGRWKEMGELQFNFLLSRGLQPDHYLLDVGCGSLRGGLHFIKFLDQERYYGMDINQRLIGAGSKLILKNGLEKKEVTLSCNDNFSLPNRTFDYVIAISLFVHIPKSAIKECIDSVAKVLAPGGKFYATIFENDHEISDRAPYRYSMEEIKEICMGTGLFVKYIGDWDNSDNQVMLLFDRDPEEELKKPEVGAFLRMRVGNFEEVKRFIEGCVKAGIVRCLSPERKKMCNNPATHILWVDEREYYPYCEEHKILIPPWTGDKKFSSHYIELCVIPEKALEWYNSLDGNERGLLEIKKYRRKE